MKLYVGVTDKKWFDFLLEKKPNEINFWRPTATQNFRSLKPGEMFLFKLHSPQNYIVGGGFFVTYSALPLSLAWESFEEKNGAPDFKTFFVNIGNYFRDKSTIQIDPFIGCIILTSPFFFDQHEWIPIPDDWKPGIQRGKTYDIKTETGAKLFSEVMMRLKDLPDLNILITDQSQVVGKESRYSKEFLTRSRLGQGTFRVLVTDAYQRKCAITGGKVLPVLEAAHIKPFDKKGPNTTSNGLLLRRDLHRLFDKGYITITKDLHTEVSKRLKEDFNNGEEYFNYHGKQLIEVPKNEINKPSKEFIEWHNENVFIG